MEDEIRVRRGRRERGSAYLYVAASAATMGTILVALLPLVVQTRTVQSRRLLTSRLELTVDALVAQVRAESKSSPIAAGSTRSLTLNGVDATVTITDGSATVKRSILLTGTATGGGSTLAISRYVSSGKALTPFSYALYSASDLATGGKIVTGTGGADGDVFSNGKITLTAPGTIVNGDMSATTNITLASDAVVTGLKDDKASSLALPAVSSVNYSLSASYLSLFTASASSLTFGSEVNGHCQIYYYSGDLSLQGPISGDGVVFVNGNLYVTGNTSYTSSSDNVAFIVQGQVIFRSACSSAVGIYYVKDQIVSESADLSITRGLIVANKITSGPIIRVVRDNVVRNSSSEGYKLCLPGYWP